MARLLHSSQPAGSTTIAKYRLKLNPEKCVFDVEAGKFLGFLLTKRGIKVNPEKCTAIIAMRSLLYTYCIYVLLP